MKTLFLILVLIFSACSPSNDMNKYSNSDLPELNKVTEFKNKCNPKQSHETFKEVAMAAFKAKLECNLNEEIIINLF